MAQTLHSATTRSKPSFFWHLTDGSNDFYVINPWFKNAFRFNQGVFCSASTSTVHFNSNTQNKNWNAEFLSSMTEITVCVSVWKWVEKWGLTVILLVTQHFLWLERKQNMAEVHVTLDRLMESPQTDIRRWDVVFLCHIKDAVVKSHPDQLRSDGKMKTTPKNIITETKPQQTKELKQQSVFYWDWS